MSNPAPYLIVALCLSPLVPSSLQAQPNKDADNKQQLERELSDQKRLIRDWGGLVHYGSDNSELQPLKPGENRVVFLGDQITEYWGKEMDDFFPGKPWLNRGVAGQTTDQMLIRFRQDVIGVKANVVVILGGLNDIAGIHGSPATEETVLDNLASMAELADANHIRVVIASLTPVCECFGKVSVRQLWQERISELNDLIEKYCARTGAVYLDYFPALADGKEMKRSLTKDGIVPNEAGYQRMAALAAKAVAVALHKQ